MTTISYLDDTVGEIFRQVRRIGGPDITEAVEATLAEMKGRGYSLIISELRSSQYELSPQTFSHKLSDPCTLLTLERDFLREVLVTECLKRFELLAQDAGAIKSSLGTAPGAVS